MLEKNWPAAGDTAGRPDISQSQNRVENIPLSVSMQAFGETFDLFGTTCPKYPELAGTKEHSIDSASRKAGESVPVKALQRIVYEDLRERGDATADEVAARLHLDVLTARPRISELRQLGLVISTELRRPSSRGISSTVWHALADRGAP